MLGSIPTQSRVTESSRGNRFSCYFSPPQVTSDFFSSERVFVASETAKATVPCVSHSPRRLILSESQHDALSSVRETVYVREVLVIPPQSSARLPVVHHNGTQAPNSPAPQAHHGRSRRRQEVVQQAQQAGIALGPRRHGGASLQSFLGFSRKPYPRPAVSRTTQRVPRRSKFSKASTRLTPRRPRPRDSADRILRRRHRLPHQEGEGREGGQEVTRSEDAHAPLSTTDAAARRGDSNFGGGFNR